MILPRKAGGYDEGGTGCDVVGVCDGAAVVAVAPLNVPLILLLFCFFLGFYQNAKFLAQCGVSEGLRIAVNCLDCPMSDGM